MPTRLILTEYQQNCVDDEIDALVDKLRYSGDCTQMLHYAVQRIIVDVLKPDSPRDYETTVGFVGMLELVKLDVVKQLGDANGCCGNQTGCRCGPNT